VHRSSDGGQTFTDLPIAYQLDGYPPASVEVLEVDPRTTQVVYVRVAIEVVTDAGDVISKQALLRSIDGGATFSQLLQLDGVITSSGISRGIDGVAVDATRGRVLVATLGGLQRADDPGGAPSLTLTPVGGLSATECVEVSGPTVYVCGNNFAPDHAAVAVSDDGGDTFRSILQFANTVGPMHCPAGTPVGDSCPSYWYMYGSQLGIANIPPSNDMGPTFTVSGGGFHCSMGTRGEVGLGLALLLLSAGGLVAIGRRRGSP
jgi:hypothetical protein